MAWIIFISQMTDLVLVIFARRFVRHSFNINQLLIAIVTAAVTPIVPYGLKYCVCQLCDITLKGNLPYVGIRLKLHKYLQNNIMLPKPTRLVINLLWDENVKKNAELYPYSGGLLKKRDISVCCTVCLSGNRNLP